MTTLTKKFFREAKAARTHGDRDVARELRWDILAKERIKKYPLSGEAMLSRLKERKRYDH